MDLHDTYFCLFLIVHSTSAVYNFQSYSLSQEAERVTSLMLCQLIGVFDCTHTQSRNIKKERTPKVQLKPTTKQKYMTHKLVSITFLFREGTSHLFKIMKDTYLHCKGNPIICPLGQSCLSLFSAKAGGRNPSSHLISPAGIS